MSVIVSWMDQKFYPNVAGNWDDDLFRLQILNYFDSKMVILDVGAGAGIVPQMNFKGHVARVCGVDPDPRVRENPYLDEGKEAFAENIPYPNESFDIVFSDNVLEHLANPSEVFVEIQRVLKPGGVFLIKTPNKRHYVPLVARLTPHAFHGFYNRLRGRRSEDTFPTLYRANSPKDLKRLADDARLELIDIQHIESRPEYLRISFLTYWFGILYERLTNRFQRLSGIRVLLIGIFRKPK